MVEPNIDEARSSQFAAGEARWLIAGHPSASPHRISALFQGNFQSYEVEGANPNFDDVLEDIDACALVINAKTGVSSSMIDFWGHVSERQFPRLMIVCGLEFSEIDFDDIVLIANRVLEQVVTPFLVLHDDVGEPIGLISLDSTDVHDYSTKTEHIYPADEELKGLIAEFRSEYQEQTEGLDDDAFGAGLVVPALPLVESRGIGISELTRYFKKATRL